MSRPSTPMEEVQLLSLLALASAFAARFSVAPDSFWFKISPSDRLESRPLIVTTVV